MTNERVLKLLAEMTDEKLMEHFSQVVARVSDDATGDAALHLECDQLLEEIRIRRQARVNLPWRW